MRRAEFISEAAECSGFIIISEEVHGLMPTFCELITSFDKLWQNQKVSALKICFNSLGLGEN